MPTLPRLGLPAAIALACCATLLGCAHTSETSSPSPASHDPSTQGAPTGSTTSPRATAPAAPPVSPRTTEPQPRYSAGPSRTTLLIGTTYERAASLPKQVGPLWSVIFPIAGGGQASVDFMVVARNGGDMLLVTAQRGEKLRGTRSEFSVNDALAVPPHDSSLVLAACARLPEKRVDTFALADPGPKGGVVWAAHLGDAAQIKRLDPNGTQQFACRWQQGTRPGSGQLSWLNTPGNRH